jgi:hypothetical protein
LLAWGNGNHSRESESKVKCPLKVELVSGLEPEESKRLLSVLLCDLHYHVQVLLPLRRVGLVDVGQERHDANGCAFALTIIDSLIKQFPQVRLDVSLVKQVVSDSLNAACVAAAFVRLGIRWR